MSYYGQQKNSKTKIIAIAIVVVIFISVIFFFASGMFNTAYNPESNKWTCYSNDDMIWYVDEPKTLTFSIGFDYTIEQIKKIIPDAKVRYIEKKEDPRNYRVSFEKIKKELGFGISMRVPDGIKEIKHLIDKERLLSSSAVT